MVNSFLMTGTDTRARPDERLDRRFVLSGSGRLQSWEGRHRQLMTDI
jgi:hypothetical protein